MSHCRSVFRHLAVLALFWTSSAYAQTTFQFDLPAQPLADALRSVGRITHVNVLFDPPKVDRLRAGALKATLTADQAFARLLVGTSLTYKFLDERTVTLSALANPDPPNQAKAATSPADPPPVTFAQSQSQGNSNPSAATQQGPTTSQDQTTSATEKSKAEALSEVVVTGTHLHNAAPITPVTIVTGDEIYAQGYSTLADVIQQMPQNFRAGAAQESNPNNGIGAGGSNNETFASGINLRGLGANATLTLLNGRRLAPTALGGVVDISQIPLGIIDRIEILPDGASALYGSDAVAGVVNIITKKSYTGVEMGGRVNSISSGKAPNYGGSVLGGFSWNSGNVVLGFDAERDNPLLARNRALTTGQPDPSYLLPENKTYSAYASLQERFADDLTLSMDTLGTYRSLFAEQGQFGLPAGAPPSQNNDTIRQFSTALQLDYRFAPGWTGTLIAQGSNERDTIEVDYPTSIPPYVYEANPNNYRVFSIEPRIDGALFDLPGGAVRIAVGGGFRREEFFQDYEHFYFENQAPNTSVITSEARHIASAYGELLVPIIGSSNALPLVQQLRLSVSGRYDRYSDFGGTTNPKVGLAWVPVSGLDLHATYARSFQAPTLYDLSTAYRAAYEYTVADPQAISGSSLAVILDGNNPNLEPETAKSFNFGFTYQPEQLKGLRFDTSYFHIDFENQINRLIDEGFFPNVLTDAAVLGSLVQRNPTLAQVQQAIAGRQVLDGNNGFCSVGSSGCPGENLANVAAIANIGYVNAAVVKVGGIDSSVRYVGSVTESGRLQVGLDGTFYTSYQQQITPTSQESSPLNTVFNPLRFRAKANVGWDLGAWRANARLNYSNAYDNTNGTNANCPAPVGCRISAWTTVDIALGYSSPSGLRVGLEVSNLFNRPPPYVSGGFYPYDPTNATILMRAVAITVNKKWGGDANR